MSMETTQKIAPFLWFDKNAEEAVDFYCSVFPNSRKIDSLLDPSGKVVTVSFELEGLELTALNVKCKDQAEIDTYWNKLLADGGKEVQCGWLDDKFGLPWQIVPQNITELVRHPKAYEAMMTMKKLIISELEAAAAS